MREGKCGCTLSGKPGSGLSKDSIPQGSDADGSAGTQSHGPGSRNSSAGFTHYGHPFLHADEIAHDAYLHGGLAHAPFMEEDIGFFAGMGMVDYRIDDLLPQS